MRSDVQSILELAVDYSNAGLWAAAARAEFEKALSLDVNQLWARVHLEE
jgi:hypothetical protein